MYVVAFVLFFAAMALFVRITSANSRRRINKVLAQPAYTGPVDHEADQALAALMIEDAAHREYSRAAANGELPPIQPTGTQRFLGAVVGFELARSTWGLAHHRWF